VETGHYIKRVVGLYRAFAGGGAAASARLSLAAVDIVKAYIDLLKAIIKLPPGAACLFYLL